MTELHPDADLVKVTRTTTTYEPAPHKAAPVAPMARPANRTLLWVGVIVAVVVIGGGALLYMNAQNTPAAVQQSAVAADQGRAQTLGDQAVSAQQGAQAAQAAADQSESKAQDLARSAAQDRAAADRAANRAARTSGAAAPATN